VLGRGPALPSFSWVRARFRPLAALRPAALELRHHRVRAGEGRSAQATPSVHPHVTHPTRGVLRLTHSAAAVGQVAPAPPEPLRDSHARSWDESPQLLPQGRAARDRNWGAACPSSVLGMLQRGGQRQQHPGDPHSPKLQLFPTLHCLSSPLLLE